MQSPLIKKVLIIVALFIVLVISLSPYAVAIGKNFFRDYSAFLDSADTVNAVIEIPAGENEKWQVKAKSGRLSCDLEDGKPRRIKYALPYPFNYGMIPQTLVSSKTGGDGDPVDIVIMGRRLKRGEVKQIRVLGILQVIDKGSIDHKIIGVPDKDNQFAGIKDLNEYDTKFPGAMEIIKIWLRNYKLNKGKVEVGGVSDKKEALDFIRQAHESYLRPSEK